MFICCCCFCSFITFLLVTLVCVILFVRRLSAVNSSMHLAFLFSTGWTRRFWYTWWGWSTGKYWRLLGTDTKSVLSIFSSTLQLLESFEWWEILPIKQQQKIRYITFRWTPANEIPFKVILFQPILRMLGCLSWSARKKYFTLRLSLSVIFFLKIGRPW